MKYETIIISEELLKLYSSISSNVDVEKVYPYILMAQQFYIEPILGTALYTDLQKEVAKKQENPDYIISSEYQALILKTAPALAQYIDYLSLRSLAYSQTEKGITKQKSENSESINRDELADYILDIKNRAELAAKLLRDYLDSCNEYPLYKPEIKTSYSSLISGIYFPKCK